MNPLKAIGFKLISALLFAGMSALVRQLGDVAPVGQVIVMLIPHFDLSHYAVAGVASVAAIGSAFALTSAICNAGTVIQTRRLTQSETTSSIVFYFSLICAIVGALTLPSARHSPTLSELTALIALGFSAVSRIFFLPRAIAMRLHRSWRPSTNRRCYGHCCLATGYSANCQKNWFIWARPLSPAPGFS